MEPYLPCQEPSREGSVREGRDRETPAFRQIIDAGTAQRLATMVDSVVIVAEATGAAFAAPCQ